MPISWQIGVMRALERSDPPSKLNAVHAFEQVRLSQSSYWWVDKHKASQGVVILAHGGAYIGGLSALHWEWVCAICSKLGIAGVLVDYRLSREASYPAAIDDYLDAIADCNTKGNLPDSKWAMLGDSAGGAMALVAARRLIDTGGPRPAAMILNSPWVDMQHKNPEPPAWEKKDAMLSRRLLDHCGTIYAGGVDKSDPALSPIEAPVEGFPPVSL